MMCKNCGMENAMPTDIECWHCGKPLFAEAPGSASPALRIQQCKSVRLASEMSDQELLDALRPLDEEIPSGHRVKPNNEYEQNTNNRRAGRLT